MAGLFGTGVAARWGGLSAEDVRSIESAFARKAGVGTARTLRVGPARDLKTPSEASRAAVDGDLVEIDAGDYPGDVATWPQSRLRLRAAGGRVRLPAAGRAAEGKAIWVVKGGAVEVEGIDFEGCRVPDGNGAGIRFEGQGLHVIDCRFRENEAGLLSANLAPAELAIERSEFDRNYRRGERWMHNLYVGACAKFAMRYCHVHRGVAGHNVKSRAAWNLLYCNRIGDDALGTASYTVEFPDGGIAILIGNILHKHQRAGNRTMLSYGAESLRWPENAFVLSHNTLLMGNDFGTYIQVHRGSPEMRFVNNLFVGDTAIALPAEASGNGNFRIDSAALADAALFDGRLRGEAPAGIAPGAYRGLALAPADSYRHPLGELPRASRTAPPAGAY